MFSNGVIEIWSWESLSKLSAIESFADDPYITMNFCTKSQRLCCCTENGFIVIHYNQTNHDETNSLDDSDDFEEMVSDDEFMDEEEGHIDVSLIDQGFSKKVYAQRIVADLFPILESLGEITHYSNKNVKEPAICKKTKTQGAGIGYGFGPVNQSWNIDATLNAQNSKEEQLIMIFQFVASVMQQFCDIISGVENDNDVSVFELLKNSCFIPALASFLRNDSILDIMKNILLYRTILKLLRSTIAAKEFVPLLLPDGNLQGISIPMLLNKMKECINLYIKCLG